MQCYPPPTASSQSQNEKKSDPAQRDTKTYASDYGVSVKEASRRLELQEKQIGKLNGKLEANEKDTFAGLWVEHEPEFRVFTRFTAEGSRTVRSYTKGTPLENLVETKPAEVTLEELKAAEYRASRELEVEGVNAESTIDVKENEVEAFVAKKTQINEVRRSQEIRLPKQATVIKVTGLSKPSARLYGGRWLYSAYAGPECTAGYSVKHRTMGRGTTTAGHCRPNPNKGNYRRLYFKYTHLPLVGTGRAYGSYDVQWHRPNGHTPVQRFWDGYGTRRVQGAKGRNRTYRGQYVCKYGLSTGYKCGRVRRTDYRPSSLYIRNPRATFIVVHNKYNRDLSAGGDSGGPWFYLNTAYGIHTAGVPFRDKGRIDAVYMPINYVNDLGLRVRW